MNAGCWVLGAEYSEMVDEETPGSITNSIDPQLNDNINNSNENTTTNVNNVAINTEGKIVQEDTEDFSNEVNETLNTTEEVPEISDEADANNDAIESTQPPLTPETPKKEIVTEPEYEERQNSIRTFDQQSTYSNMTPNKRFSSSHLNETASITFLKSSFENLIGIKEILKKHQFIVQKATTAIGILKTGEMPPEEVIFEPLKLACEQSNIEAKILALDCLSKIFIFNLFTKPIYWDYKANKKDKLETDIDIDGSLGSQVQEGKILLIEAAINVVVSCFDGEGTDERVELQIIRVLTSAVVNESMPVHGKVLLQAIRQIHNIFLLSLSAVNQSIAQASLIQIVDSVYQKVSALQSKKKALAAANRIDDNSNNSNALLNKVENVQKMTLQQLQDTSNDNVQLLSDEIIGDDDELYIKDAFLIFRSMSNLASKIIETESLDMRSHKIRVKLLSLHIIHSILKNYMDVFVNKDYLIFNKNSSETTILVDGIRKYLCLAISRNATTQLAPVYEVTLEIYWLVITNLRSEFKYEIPVFLDEIYFPVSELKTATSYQKRYVLEIIRRLCGDPKILIEFYLNYDCDTLLPNLCERIVDYLAKYALLRVDVTLQQKLNFKTFQTTRSLTRELENIPELNSSKLTSVPPNPDASASFPIDFALKMVAIDCIVSFLQSLNISSGAPLQIGSHNSDSTNSTAIDDLKSIVNETRMRGSSIASASHSSLSHSDVNLNSNESEEISSDTTKFDAAKQKKTFLIEGIKLFSFSAKKGIAYLSKNGFLKSGNPVSIAQFILDNDTLDKTQVGEYLGGSKEENIAVMHAFVDLMDFKSKSFLDALRSFLQHFRLPGESQVIDRFMLKFAEKYVNDNPKTFANADTVYVLSYSVIMLNTDQHSPQIKKRMTLDDFIKNNRGIDDGKDLDPKFLKEVFDDIRNNEIILNSEQQAAIISNDSSSQQTYLTTAIFGRDYATREAYTKASKVLSKKTENTVILLGKSSKKNTKYYTSDSNPDHVKSMFENLWMSLLAGLTPPFKEYDDEEIAGLLLFGIRLSVHLSCIFDIDYARTSFVRALVQFTNINNPEDMKDKNIEAIHVLLDIAVDENSYLKSSWRDIFIVISQVERLRLLSKGVSSNSIPDLLNARLTKKSIDIRRQENASSGFFSLGGKRQSISQQAFEHHFNQKLPAEMIIKITSTELDVSMDKVFSKSFEIQGDGIFDFVSGLVDVARDEITSSANSKEPRIFCLQKMVDVCYYNMGRIRLQWSELWKVMNQEFNEFGCNTNKTVAFFAIDSLRQLSERFFNIEELSHFKFQKEFLKPFDYIIVNNLNLEVRQMVLDSVQYLIMKKADHIKSGWTTILKILTHAAYSEDSEKFVSSGLKYVIQITDVYIDSVEEQDAFSILVDCLTEYAKNEKFQKISLKALSMINQLVEKIGNEVDQRVGDDDYLNKRWFPLLFSFNNIIMEGNDLEVRSKALNFMFEALIIHGKNFDEEFWKKICTELLFPIFDILKRHGQINFNQNESLWVWLSSTLIQALRKMILLFTTFFNELNGSMDGYLSLLISCICQDNDAISKIGISCLEDLILNNMGQFKDEHWKKIEITFNELFKLTSASELFELDPLKKGKNVLNGKNSHKNNNEDENHFKVDDENGDDDDEEEEEEDNEQSYSEIGINGAVSSTSNESNYSSQEIVIKCVLHLHMIQILSELFDNSDFYNTIPYDNLVELTKLLYHSYKFAKEFNEDYNLRVRLWNAGVVDKLPNLLKQETSSVGVYIGVLFRLYCDESKANLEAREKIVNILIPLVIDLIKRSNEFEEREETRNLQSWMPVVVEIVQAITELYESDFKRACPETYSYVVSLFRRNMSVELREVMKEYMVRVGDIYVQPVKNVNNAM
ncbi:guanine nucleotide exchange protein for ADP-robosylation factor [Pichia californica]|nr:guanine nucleotide exchange protein for ADP-robosylation factor [[Candida] californica]